MIGIDIRNAFNTVRSKDYIVMYGNNLRMDLPAKMSIICSADHALFVCVAEDVAIMHLRIDESLWQAKH